MNSFPPEEHNLQLALVNLNWLLTQQDIANIESLGANAHEQHTQDSLKKLGLHEHQEQLATSLAASGSHFLGNYVERLWQFYLEYTPRYHLIKQGLQIHDSGKTVGEFDFIVHDSANNTYVHQELAIKFYLGLPCQDQTRWFGPQNIDRLDKKTTHLRDRQLRLSQNPIAQEALGKLGIDQISAECIIKGRLFLPYDAQLAKAITYADKNTESLEKGLWLRFQEFETWLAKQAIDQRYHILQKRQWMSLDLNHHFSESLDANRLIECIRDDITLDARSIMIAVEPKPNAASNPFHFFVVPDDWAEKAYASIEGIGEEPPNPRHP